MKKTFLFLFYVISTALSYAQSVNDYPKYFLLTHEASTLIKLKKFGLALDKYKEAFHSVNYILNKDLTKALQIAKKIGVDSLEIKYREQLSSNNKKVNTVYQKEIVDIFKMDQRVRTNKYLKALDYYNICNTDSTFDRNNKKYLQAKLKSEEWRNTDSTNINKLLDLINRNGFPSESTVGVESAGKAFIILLHFDYDKDNHILKPILDSALMDGGITPRNYAQIVDRRKINLNQNPIYYVIPLGYDNLTEEQKKNVDSVRVKIGLPTISKSQKIIKTKNSIRVIYDD